MSGPLWDLGDTMVNKIGFVLVPSGERDNQQENKTITRNAGEEAKEGDRDKVVGKGVGETYSSRPLGRISMKDGSLN